jgi:hypothetical protein
LKSRATSAGFTASLVRIVNQAMIANVSVSGRYPLPWSIPPRATKNLNSPLVGLFSFRAWQG